MISEENKKNLVLAQTAKMETACIYKYIASKVSDKNIQGLLLKMASEEGKHAGILRKYTHETIPIKAKPSLRFRLWYKLSTRKMMLRMLLMSEQKNAESYSKAAKHNPVLREIANAEKEHTKILEKILAK